MRWYLARGPSLRDLEEMIAERGIRVDHFTIQHLGTISQIISSGCLKPAICWKCWADHRFRGILSGSGRRSVLFQDDGRLQQHGQTRALEP
jgi:hypothetical protein